MFENGAWKILEKTALFNYISGLLKIINIPFKYLNFRPKFGKLIFDLGILDLCMKVFNFEFSPLTEKIFLQSSI